MDAYDRKILAALQRDGRISNLELADSIGLSPTPCARRVKALEEARVIRDYVARLSPESLELRLTAMLHISMDKHTPERFEAFEGAVREFPEVVECYLITGQSADYVLKVLVRDMDHYQQFLLGKLTRLEGVTGVHSSFVMRKIIDQGPLSLNHL